MSVAKNCGDAFTVTGLSLAKVFLNGAYGWDSVGANCRGISGEAIADYGGGGFHVVGRLVKVGRGLDPAGGVIIF